MASQSGPMSSVAVNISEPKSVQVKCSSDFCSVW